MRSKKKLTVVASSKPTMLMIHKIDPARVILDAVGDLSELELFGNQVLLGVYERPNQTASGLFLSDQTIREDEHQGKVGLVLKKGPSAFVSDSNYDFKGQNVERGDWVAMWVSDGRRIKLKGQLCRVVEDMHIRMKVPYPDFVY